ncbi:hypothetical protein LPJ57_010890 [Coemansia sp. RSA 486]|nr:hypothetical protein LPJ57_010890 [Coemansia sp. RSA 486]
MFGDLPRRTVKTIHHTIISYLGIYSWQFCGLIIRDVMEADNTLIRPAPSMTSNVNDPAMIQWAQDTHGKLVRASETWGYVHTCLEADEYNGGAPTVAQLLVAMNAALNSPSSEVGDDLSDEDNDVVMSSVPTSNYHIQQQQQQLFNQPASRGSYAGSAASVSPYQQPRQVGYSSQMQTTANNFSAARAQSPSAYSSSSRIGSMPHSYQPPAPAMARVSSPQPTGLPPMAPAGASGEYRSTQERFNALRARILNSQSILPQAQHPTSMPAPSSPISTGSASSAIPGRRLAAVDMSSTGIQPPEVPRTMEDIGARIARMRNSLRSNSTSKQ